MNQLKTLLTALHDCQHERDRLKAELHFENEQVKRLSDADVKLIELREELEQAQLSIGARDATIAALEKQANARRELVRTLEREVQQLIHEKGADALRPTDDERIAELTKQRDELSRRLLDAEERLAVANIERPADYMVTSS
jgi:chromosome segregation ATPase